MKTLIATTLLLSLFGSVSAFAAKAGNVGDRVFSPASRSFEIPKVGQQSRRLGAGTIIGIAKDGSALFLPDRRLQDSVPDEEIQLTVDETLALRKSVRCLALMGTGVYANQMGTVEYRGVRVKTVLGEGRIVETFGNCERGVAIFQRLDLALHTTQKIAVSIPAILPEVSCKFIDEKVLAPKLGLGIAKRAWGDCAKGIVTFESIRRNTALISVSTETLRF